MVKTRDIKTGRFIKTQPLSRKEYSKQYMKIWREQNKLYRDGYLKQWKSSLPDNIKQHESNRKEQKKEYYKLNKEIIRERNYKYKHTDYGKQSLRKTKSKRRNMKYVESISNPFPDEIEVEYHHINNLIVLPIPKSLHRKYSGNKVKYHRKCMDKIINDLYCLDMEELLS